MDLQDKQALAENVKFRKNGKEIERVQSFKYLGQIISEDNNDTICIKIKNTRTSQITISDFLSYRQVNKSVNELDNRP